MFVSFIVIQSFPSSALALIMPSIPGLQTLVIYQDISLVMYCAGYYSPLHIQMEQLADINVFNINSI